MGYCPNCIVKKKKSLYCNLAIVLQERGLEKNCIAIVLQEKGVVGLGLYCNRKKIVLQPRCVVGWHCIAREGKLYCNRGLYCNIGCVVAKNCIKRRLLRIVLQYNYCIAT